MSWLLIDNSNTRTKFALGDASGLGPWRGVVPTAEISPDTLAAVVADNAFSAVMICSVVPDKSELMSAFFRPRCPVEVLGCQSPLGLGIDYPIPEQIGADRLANAVGVVARYGAPAIVIDFGTAVTFDVISDAPAYCGGVIAPGLGAMSGYLPQRTALLPVIELEEPAAAIGKSTVQAMLSGAVFGYRGLVREIISQITSELPNRPKIVATGGDATLISRGIPEIDTVDPDITMEGIRLVSVRSFQ